MNDRNTDIDADSGVIKMKIKTLISGAIGLVMTVLIAAGVYYGLATKAELSETKKELKAELKEKSSAQEQAQAEIKKEAAVREKRVTQSENDIKGLNKDTDYIKKRIDFLTENAVADRAIRRVEGTPQQRAAAKRAAERYRKAQEQAPDDPLAPLEGL